MKTNNTSVYSTYISGLYLAHFATEDEAKAHAATLWLDGPDLGGVVYHHKPGTLWLDGHGVRTEKGEESPWDFSVDEIPWVEWVDSI